MARLINMESNLPWIEADSLLETFLTDEMPPIKECSAAYVFVFKDGALLQTELQEGERPQRQLDIPGGHIDENETPEDAAIRETFEETGVLIQQPKLVAYSKVSISSEKPERYRYPYPASYMLFYKTDSFEEFPFNGNEEVHGRVWLPVNESEKSEWCVKNRTLLTEILKAA